MLEYSMAIGKKSIWEIATTTAQARRLPFYLIEWGYFFAESNYFTKRNNSDMYLIFATISGKGQLYYEGNKYILNQGSVAVISCDALHHYSTLSDEIWEFKWTTFNGTAANEYYKLINPNGINILQTLNIQEYSRFIDDIGKYTPHQEIIQSLCASDVITKMLKRIITERIEGERASSGTEKLDVILNYIENNYEKKILLLTLANMIHISKFHFIRLFKTHIGVTPHEYIINIRIKKAKELLVITDFSLAQIAEKTGFCDSKNLILNFKKHTLMTPGKYRNINSR